MSKRIIPVERRPQVIAAQTSGPLLKLYAQARGDERTSHPYVEQDGKGFEFEITDPQGTPGIPGRFYYSEEFWTFPKSVDWLDAAERLATLTAEEIRARGLVRCYRFTTDPNNARRWSYPKRKDAEKVALELPEELRKYLSVTDLNEENPY